HPRIHRGEGASCAALDVAARARMAVSPGAGTAPPVAALPRPRPEIRLDRGPDAHGQASGARVCTNCRTFLTRFPPSVAGVVWCDSPAPNTIPNAFVFATSSG